MPGRGAGATGISCPVRIGHQGVALLFTWDMIWYCIVCNKLVILSSDGGCELPPPTDMGPERFLLS